MRHATANTLKELWRIIEMDEKGFRNGLGQSDSEARAAL